MAGLIHKDGVFEAVMVLKNLPYLDNSLIHRRYDAIEVADIMSEGPVELLAPQERAQHLVDILARSAHNGFPVADPETKKFLGLIRRDQIAALLECGVFESVPLRGNSDDTASAWARPKAGVVKSPLMRKFLCSLSLKRLDFVAAVHLQVTQAGLTTLMMIDMTIFLRILATRKCMPQSLFSKLHATV